MVTANVTRSREQSMLTDGSGTPKTVFTQRRLAENTQSRKLFTPTDARYFSSDVVTALTADGIDVYMPPDKMSHAYKMPAAPRGRIPKGLSIMGRMRRKLKTKQGRKRYGLWKELPEPVFGQINQVRGFRQFLPREKVRCECESICTGHNLLKLFLSGAGRLIGQYLQGQLSNKGQQTRAQKGSMSL